MDTLLCECLGHRIDRLAPEGFSNGFGTGYLELREFFLRFAPDVASYLPRGQVRPDSVQRLRAIQFALCQRIASESPATLGRFGPTLLSRDWKEMEADLPNLERALASLALVADGKAIMQECRSELETILDRWLPDHADAKGLLSLRSALRRTIARRAPGGEPS